jgi:hypothetical protein
VIHRVKALLHREHGRNNGGEDDDGDSHGRQDFGKGKSRLVRMVR